MSESLPVRFADLVVSHSKLVVALVLVVSAVVAAGAAVGDPEDGGIGQFETDSEEANALSEIEATYGTDEGVVAQVVIREEGGDVLTRESLLAGLELQREVRETASVNATLEEPGVLALENVVATGAVFEDRVAEAEGPPDTTEPTLDEQIDALESRSDEDVEELLAGVLDPEADSSDGEEPASAESDDAFDRGDDGASGGESAVAGDEADPYEFLPTEYEPGSTTADARIAFVFQVDDGGPDEDPDAAYDAQVELADLVDERFEDAFVFGGGIVDEATGNAVGDSFAIITPVALVLVLAALTVAYRDAVDVLVSIVGIGVVMAWLGGAMGWLEIPMSQLLIAVPFLLIGLGIDYSLHVIMRSREARAGKLEGVSATTTGDGSAGGEEPNRRSVRWGMRLGLTGVVLALAAATFSTGIGFLSNVVSPLPAIRDFAILSAVGIFATFVAFALLVPALKVEIDDLLESRFGVDRRKSPFGRGAGLVNRGLSSVVAVVRRVPLAVVAVAVLLAIGGAYGATGIDTEFNEADFLPENPPEWTSALPGPLEPGTYTVGDDAEYLSDNFQERGEGTQSQILIRGDVTDPATLEAIDRATADVDGDGTIVVRSDGAPAIESPASVSRAVAAENESVAVALEERDETGDDLPDEDVDGFYDELYEADPDAASAVLFRSGDGVEPAEAGDASLAENGAAGEYESARLLVDVRGDASTQAVADDTRELAAAIEDDAPVTAVATGGPVTTAVIQDALLETLVQAFALTLAVIGAFLTILYWVRYRTLSFGLVTLAPVVAALAWLLGAMALLDIPFNSETAVITSLAIGLGVDYSIHVSERFLDERRRASPDGIGDDGSRRARDALDDALSATITGTGGALLGSAMTTAAGFGVLALALAPPLQRFGLVTALSIVLAFVSCVTVLPCLLVVRERLLAWISTLRAEKTSI
ncbi:RND family transporter [Natrarchaeobius sp. A-rgal3]|uniref:efflux RND transporter permease subunit n=1 Tax=Natrarchaeobius versutus TaxID=1679078 RepID=UPI00350FC565